jgi:hypothetical protein
MQRTAGDSLLQDCRKPPINLHNYTYQHDRLFTQPAMQTPRDALRRPTGTSFSCAWTDTVLN